MHYAVVRAAGITVSGQPPARTIGPVGRDVVLRYLADELRWAESHAGEAYGVLNAARASRFLDAGRILSKIDGGRQAIAAGGPAALLGRAIDVQEGRREDRPPTADALALHALGPSSAHRCDRRVAGDCGAGRPSRGRLEWCATVGTLAVCKVCCTALPGGDDVSPTGLSRLALRDTVPTALETEYLGGTSWPGPHQKHSTRPAGCRCVDLPARRRLSEPEAHRHVAVARGLSPASGRKRVLAARRAGLLSETEPGRPAGA